MDALRVLIPKKKIKKKNELDKNRMAHQLHEYGAKDTIT